MTSRASVVVFDCGDAESLSHFWAEALGWTAQAPDDRGWVVVAPSEERAPFILLFVPVPEVLTEKNRLHLDLNPVGVDYTNELERLIALGATMTMHAAPDDPWTTLKDPEGNLFCLMHRSIT